MEPRSRRCRTARARTVKAEGRKEEGCKEEGREEEGCKEATQHQQNPDDEHEAQVRKEADVFEEADILEEAMIRVVRLGSPRAKDEGPRLGTVRRPPRGVPKSEFASRDFYDVWLPELAPSGDVVSAAMSQAWTDKRWQQFARTYRREMRQPAAQHLIATLAALSHQANFAIGCYCEDEARCHRSILRGLLIEAGAKL